MKNITSARKFSIILFGILVIVGSVLIKLTTEDKVASTTFTEEECTTMRTETSTLIKNREIPELNKLVISKNNIFEKELLFQENYQMTIDYLEKKVGVTSTNDLSYIPCALAVASQMSWEGAEIKFAWESGIESYSITTANLNGKPVETSKGLKVGDSSTKVFELYPNAIIEKFQDDTTIYLEKDKCGSQKVKLDNGDSGKVVSISASKSKNC